MLRNKCMLASLLVLVLAISNFVDAANQPYIVSFVAGEPGLGLAGSIAPQKFVLSATDGGSIILKIIELNKFKVTTTQSRVIALDPSWTIRDTAVTFRNENNRMNFDIYYGACQDLDQDWDCDETIQTIIRTDSNLNSIFHKNLGPTNHEGFDPYDIVMQRIQQQSGFSLRLLTSDGTNILEQDLHRDGNLGLPSNVGIRGYYDFSAAEDGKMIATIPGSPSRTSRIIQIRPFHPNGSINSIQTEDIIWNLALTGPVAGASPSLSAGSLPVSNRFLFFVTQRFIGTEYMSRVMKQKINNSTGKFIGVPKPFTEFKIDRNGASTVAVTPGGNIVFYTEWLCDKKVLKAQVFNPQTGAKVGPSQTILGCGDHQFHISGINVTRFQ